MHLFTFITAVSCVLVAIVATPVKHDPSPSGCPNPANPGQGGSGAGNGVSAAVKKNVTTTVMQWLNDIKTVNTFVDTAGNLTDPAAISQAATTAFGAAQGEGNSLNILLGEVTLDAAGQTAADELPAQFNKIGPAINDTIANPQNLAQNLKIVDDAR